MFAYQVESVYLFFAGRGDNFTESNTDSLPLITFFTVQTSLQYWDNLWQNSLAQFTNKVP